MTQWIDDLVARLSPKQREANLRRAATLGLAGGTAKGTVMTTDEVLALKGRILDDYVRAKAAVATARAEVERSERTLRDALEHFDRCTETMKQLGVL